MTNWSLIGSNWRARAQSKREPWLAEKRGQPGTTAVPPWNGFARNGCSTSTRKWYKYKRYKYKKSPSGFTKALSQKKCFVPVYVACEEYLIIQRYYGHELPWSHPFLHFSSPPELRKSYSAGAKFTELVFLADAKCNPDTAGLSSGRLDEHVTAFPRATR